MRDLCEVSWQKEDTEEEPIMVKEKYFLLHFGLKYAIINNVAVNYTVAICQNYKTGQLEMFDPSQIRILGTEIKK